MPPLVFLRLSFLLFAAHDILPDWLASLAQSMLLGSSKTDDGCAVDSAFADHWLTRYAQWLIWSNDPALPAGATVATLEAHMRGVAIRNQVAMDQIESPVKQGMERGEVLVTDETVVRICVYFASPVLVTPGEFRQDIEYFGASLLAGEDGNLCVCTPAYDFLNPITGSRIPPSRSPFFCSLTGRYDA